MQDPVYVPAMTVNPYASSVYSYRLHEYSANRYNSASLNNLSNNSTNGVVSRIARSKIHKCIGWLDVISRNKRVYNEGTGSSWKWKIGLVTLTLSNKQNHSDQFIKRNMLNSFLVMAKEKWGLEHYVWRAEAQKNGNIHFHIVTGVWIPHRELRDTWNSIQSRYGYINVEKYGNNPNSTDVHSLRKVRNISAYLAKYVSKDGSAGRAIDGRIWGCSRKLGKLRGVQLLLEPDKMSQLRKWWRSEKQSVVVMERCSVIRKNLYEMCRQFNWIRDAVLSSVRSVLNDIHTFVNPLINKKKICVNQNLSPPNLYQQLQLSLIC
jgi:hypothetical protein